MVGNYGQSTTYDIALRLAGNNGEVMFSGDSITLPGNTSHHIIPNWGDLANDSLKILIDSGNNGGYDDSMYVNNNIVADVDEDEHGNILPHQFELSQNYPNPFNPVTNIKYNIPARSYVTIEVYNVIGQKIRTLVDENKSAGEYHTTWNGDDSYGQKVSTGVYFCRFQAGDYVETKKMILLK